MKSNTNMRISKSQKPTHDTGQGLNWVLIVGGALLSTLSVRLGLSVKQALERKWLDTSGSASKANGKATYRRSRAFPLHSTTCCFTQDENGYHHCLSGIAEGTVEMKQHPTSPLSKETTLALPLVTITAPESTRDNGMFWGSSPERLEFPQKPFHHSNSSDSPCVSEFGSEILSSKREVINKLRQQLKRRDEMILEMQVQITKLENSSNAQLRHSTHLQAQLDSANRDLFESGREIQRLRTIADPSMGEMGSDRNPMMCGNWQAEPRNGQVNGLIDNSCGMESQYVGADKACILGQDVERLMMLKREIEELKEVIEAKEFLLRSYKEHNMELGSKMKELQLRLVSQVPSIL